MKGFLENRSLEEPVTTPDKYRHLSKISPRVTRIFKGAKCRVALSGGSSSPSLHTVEEAVGCFLCSRYEKLTPDAAASSGPPRDQGLKPGSPPHPGTLTAHMICTRRLAGGCSGAHRVLRSHRQGWPRGNPALRAFQINSSGVEAELLREAEPERWCVR